MCLGIIGLVTSVGSDRTVEVRAGDRDITASLLAMTDGVRVGDWVVVHSGLVLARLTEQEATEALVLRSGGPSVERVGPVAGGGQVGPVAGGGQVEGP